MIENFVNVLTHPRAGWLDEISQEATDRDLTAILGYIRADKQAAELRSEHSNPSIARAVLTAIWQEPRTGFHRREIDGRKGIYFGSKLLLIPWSFEAFDRMKTQNGTKGLILEHVMPIDAMWKHLIELEATTDDDETWALEAQAYLWRNFTLAVVTTEQAKAIDAAGFKKVGVAGQPFARYFQAAEKMHKDGTSEDPPAVLDVSRFLHPGMDQREHAEGGLIIEEDSDDV